MLDRDAISRCYFYDGLTGGTDEDLRFDKWLNALLVMTTGRVEAMVADFTPDHGVAAYVVIRGGYHDV